MKDTNLYVTNLPKDITLQQIDNLFKEYGEIVQKTLLNDKYTGMPRGVAFVRYFIVKMLPKIIWYYLFQEQIFVMKKRFGFFINMKEN